MGKKVFVIDVARCSGCHNCQLSCKDEHCENDWRPYAAPQPPTGQFWCKVTDHPRGQIPKVKIHYLPVLCNHCDNAPCMQTARDGAIYRRPDGLVVIDPAKAQGQRELVDACPYGAIFWNEELALPQKCTGCAHLLDHGSKVPRCVEACPTEALKFGDEEELAELLQDAVVLHPEYGTAPRVYYRNIPGCFLGGLVYDPKEEEVLIGAKVTLTLEDGTVQETVTDDFGDFWFRELPECAASVTIEAPGYCTRTFDGLDTRSCPNLGDIPMERG
ncbi:MAG: carboxypeptidase regulatory-like domain-containing protein [Oscillospiraceae bacterium]|nr:carboxypeptidase regulatory-like domain-containing protein [Oscillospiraceae bacterium]